MKLLFILLTFASNSVLAQTAPTENAVKSSSITETQPVKPTEKDKKKKAEEPQATPVVATTSPAPNPDEVKTLKKIVITGSYIRQAPSEKSATPVTVVDNQKMSEASKYTAAAALSEIAAVSSNTEGASISLHGQTSADNLILLNGLRLPKANGGSYVNIDFLPASALERTEILKDGASALYGSEALAGVINFVTKKDYEGFNADIHTSSPQVHGDQDTTIGFTGGKNFGRTNILGVVQYRRKEAITWRDLSDYYGLRDVPNYGALQSPYGNVKDGSKGYRSPFCPSNLIGPDGTCRYDYLSDRSYQGSRETGGGEQRNSYTAFLDINSNISDAFKLELTNVYVYRNGLTQSNPVPMTFRNETATGGKDYRIPAANANNWGVIDPATGNPFTGFVNPITLQYSALEELGPRIFERDTHNIVSQARLYGDLGAWNWETSVGYGYTYYKDTNTYGNADKDMLLTMIKNNQFNPFKNIGAKDDLSAAMLETWSRDKADITDSKVILAGPLFQLGATPLSMAVGGEGQWISFKRENDPNSLANTTIGGQATDQQGRREVSSAFIELSNSPFKSLEIQLAGRFDSYNDVGETLNPKIGLSYHLSDKFTLRSSYGTGFKAPDMISVYQGTRTNQSSLRDEAVCKAKGESDPQCNSGIYPVTTYGNKNLSPETASHYNVGLVITPQPKTLMVVDYWSVDGEDGLSAVDPADAIRNEALYGIPKPSSVIVNRDSQGYITSISHPTRLNGAIFKIRGIDFKIQKQFSINALGLGAYNLRFDLDHSHILYSGGNDSPTDPYTKQFDLNYTNIMGIGLANEKHFSRLGARTFNGTDYNTNSIGLGAGSTYTLTEFDIHHEWFLSEKVSISGGIKDIFNSQPVRVQPGFDVSAGGNGLSYGRTFYLGYSQDF